MKSRTKIIDEFMDMGTRFTFSAAEHHYEGYIASVSSDSLHFTPAGPMATGDEITIALESIDLNTLCFLDERTRGYKSAMWSEAEQRWLIVPLKKK